MSAVKLARGYTKRDKIIKFAGCYHGHYDGFLVEAGSGVLTNRISSSVGVPDDNIKNTLIARYNDINSVKELFKNYKDEIAGIIIEPIAGNMGVIKAKEEFLKELRELCDKNNSVLIFDEVMTGFRVDYKGATSKYNVKPDLITYAKIIGGGLPSGAYAGKKEIMSMVSPLGYVYQAGTMSGNPVVMSAGLATLQELYNNREEIYSHLESIGAYLEEGIKKVAREKGYPVVINRSGSMFTIFFTSEDKVQYFEDVKNCNNKNFKKFFIHMLENGINLPPSQFEALFLSSRHTMEDMKEFIRIFGELKL